MLCFYEQIKRRIARSGQRSDDDDDDGLSTPDYLLLSACVPDACNPSDFFGPLGVDILCQTKDESKKLDATDIACM